MYTQRLRLLCRNRLEILSNKLLRNGYQSMRDIANKRMEHTIERQGMHD